MVRLRLSMLLLAVGFGSMVGCSSTSRFNLFHRNTATTTETCPDMGPGLGCEGSGMPESMGADGTSTMLMPEATFPQGTMLPQGTTLPPGTLLPTAPTPMTTAPPPGTLQTIPPQSRLQPAPAPVKPMPYTP
jgi:hypothetical protein